MADMLPSEPFGLAYRIGKAAAVYAATVPPINPSTVLAKTAAFAKRSWFGAILVTALEFFIIDEVIGILSSLSNTIKGAGILLTAKEFPEQAKRAIAFIADEVTKETPLFEDLAAITIQQITGVNIDQAKIAQDRAGGDLGIYRRSLGHEFYQVVTDMLNATEAANDFQNRVGEKGSFGNLDAYFGTNLEFQLRSLTIGTIASALGWNSLRHLEGLHQSINWAFGFGWLSWSVLSNAMDVTVNAGLKRHFLRQVKPHDLSQAQANKGRIRGLIDATVWQQIHANAGMRDDARDWQLALEYNQPSLSTVHKVYLHGEVTPAQLDQQMLNHELTPEGATWNKSEIVNGRKWEQEGHVGATALRHLQHGWIAKQDAATTLARFGWNSTESDLATEAHASERVFHLREAVTREHLKFLRKGWESQDDTRNWLLSQHWTDEEIQLAFEANRLEQKAQHLKAPPHLALGTVAALVASGSWDPLRGQAYLLNLGYDPNDVASVLGHAILEHMVAITPKKVRDACEQEGHLANLLTTALAALTVVDPGQIVANADFRRLVTCWITSLQPAGGTPAPPPVQRPPAPQALRYGPLPGGIKLDWDAIPFLADYVVYRRTIGDASPIGIGFPGTLTTYTDTGITKGQIYIYSVRAKIAGVESVDSNEVQVLVP